MDLVSVVLHVTIAPARMDNDKRGFTLIELIIVVFIVVLFAGLSLANYGQFNEEKKLDDEAKKLSAILYLARTKATAADTDPNLAPCSDFQGYRVLFTSAPPSYTYMMERNCGGTYKSVQAQTLSSNITFNTAVSQILFKPLNAGTDLTSKTKIIIKSTTLEKCIDIQVAPSAVIDEGKKYTTGC